MTQHRPFRFGTQVLTAASGAEWSEKARRVKALGYSTLLISDHFLGNFAPISALTAAAFATTTLRVGTTVAANGFRHPAVLAKEMATLDVLSDGRLEVGIGAGWLKEEYDKTGIPFDTPTVRVSRMKEAVRIIKGLWSENAVTFGGDHYTVTGLEGWPKPLQRPHPPLFIGGGGKRLLTFAAQEANIVGFAVQARREGGVEPELEGETCLEERVAWVREATKGRKVPPELAILILNVMISDDVASGVEAVARFRGWTPEQVAASPYMHVGSLDAIVERLQEMRERYGLSYFTIYPHDIENFAPIVARLAGR
jgi:probable F420-dependent oxidoreductase